MSYQAAFALLKNSQYDQAIQAFQSFLSTYPTSPLADNAQYWLGEAYYVNRSFPEALAAFQKVVDKYPQSRKVPDALLKVGLLRLRAQAIQGGEGRADPGPDDLRRHARRAIWRSSAWRRWRPRSIEAAERHWQ